MLNIKSLDEDPDIYFSCNSSSSDENFADVSGFDEHLGDKLHNTFCSHPKNLNVCHINAQSIPSHYSELLSTFGSDHIHAVLVSESFLKPSLQSTSFAIPGFVLLRNDRTGKGCGGVAIYLRSHLTFKIISQSPSFYSRSAEYIFIEIDLKSTKFLLGVVYSPPTIEYFDSFESLLEQHIPSYEHNLIMGDFNTCLMKDDSRSKRFNLICRSFNLTILPLNNTFNINNSSSLLDLILTSNPGRITSHGQYPASGFSHHDLIFASYRIRTPRYKPKILFQRSFNRMDQDMLRADALKMNWHDILCEENVDGMVAKFNCILLDLYNKHAPIHPVRMKRPPAPWLDDKIRAAMRRRDTIRRKFKQEPSDEKWKAFKKARNRVNQLCRDAKRQYIYSTIKSCTSENTWKFLRSLGLGRSKSDCTLPTDINGLNQHFSTAAATIDPQIKNAFITRIESLTRNTNKFVFQPVSLCEVKKYISGSTSKAVGYDDIGRCLIVPIIDILLPYITYIINTSISSAHFPSLWKNSHLVPISKKLSSADFNNFRPISIVPFLSKILERVVYKQWATFLDNNKLLNPWQSGFKTSHSTTTALVKITDDIRNAIDKKKLTLLVLLDFSNAFNCVDHDILMAIMRSLHMSPTAAQWFDSYLRGRRQRISFNNLTSEWCSVTAGIPQGCVLSPLLFSIYINSLVEVITHSLFHLYADDLQLYSHFDHSEVNDAVRKINSDLDAIHIRSQNMGLLVNPVKTQVIILGTKHMLSKLDMASISPITVNKTPISFSQHVTNLGLHITCDLAWDTHVAEISKKIYSSMHMLKRLQWFIPLKTKLMLVNSLLLPIIDYADVCYPDINEDVLNRLDRLLNVLIRFVFGLRKYDHISKYREQLKWLNIRSRRSVHILLLLYNILNNINSPLYLKSNFQFLNDCHDRPLRSSNNNLLNIPPHTSTRYTDSFTVSAARQWNSLPLSIRQAPSVGIFKRQLINHYRSQQFN